MNLVPQEGNHLYPPLGFLLDSSYLKVPPGTVLAQFALILTRREPGDDGLELCYRHLVYTVVVDDGPASRAQAPHNEAARRLLHTFPVDTRLEELRRPGPGLGIVLIFSPAAFPPRARDKRGLDTRRSAGLGVWEATYQMRTGNGHGEAGRGRGRGRDRDRR